MDDKELRKLNRQEILEILLEVTKENESLKEELQETKKLLKSRTLTLEKAGNIADASLKLSGVFERAQLAADVYLQNLKLLEQQKKKELALLKEQTGTSNVTDESDA